MLKPTFQACSNDRSLSTEASLSIETSLVLLYLLVFRIVVLCVVLKAYLTLVDRFLFLASSVVHLFSFTPCIADVYQQVKFRLLQFTVRWSCSLCTAEHEECRFSCFFLVFFLLLVPCACFCVSDQYCFVPFVCLLYSLVFRRDIFCCPVFFLFCLVGGPPCPIFMVSPRPFSFVCQGRGNGGVDYPRRCRTDRHPSRGQRQCIHVSDWWPSLDSTTTVVVDLA